jgi:integrase
MVSSTSTLQSETTNNTSSTSQLISKSSSSTGYASTLQMECSYLDFIKACLPSSLSSETIQAILANFKRSNSSYNSAWAAWCEFGKSSNSRWDAYSGSRISNFVTWLAISKKIKTGTAANYSSLITTIFRVATSTAMNMKLERPRVLDITLRGLRQLNPEVRSRYESIWDTDRLLAWIYKNLADNDRLSEADLRLKALALTALSIYGRPSDLAALKYDQFKMESESIIFKSRARKTSETGSSNSSDRRIFPCSTVPEVCPVMALLSYMKNTITLGQRKEDTGQGVFLCLSKVGSKRYKSLKTSSISSILKKLLESNKTQESTQASSPYRAESFRHAAASRAYRDSATEDKIKDRGGWTSTSTLETHYRRVDLLKDRLQPNTHWQADIFSNLQLIDLEKYIPDDPM